nr:hypothetical protein GCM10020093_082120 [Planobispora longispora]
MTVTDTPERDDSEKAAEARPAKLGAVGWARWFWRTLTSMRTALILLFLFALASIPGSIWPQRGVSDAMVGQYYADDPELAEWLDRFWLFDVFKAPWFAAIYLLLFLSLIGCVLPRTMAHLRELRKKPPAAPRNLSRLPQHAVLDGDLTVEEAARRLRRLRFRVTTGPGWVSAEKGYLKETGNLLFHVALLGLLVAIGVGALYGYRGNVLVVEGDGFANTVAAYDRYMPGQQVNAESLEPFSFTLEDFQATYIAKGDKRGQALDYSAKLAVSDLPGPRADVRAEGQRAARRERHHDLPPRPRVRAHLQDHRRQGPGGLRGSVPCLVIDPATFTSECVIKVADAQPEQLGILVAFLPSTVPAEGGEWVSIFPGAANPTAQVYGAFAGDLGMRDGVPQSVYEIPGDPEETEAAGHEGRSAGRGPEARPAGRGGLDRVHRRQGVDRPPDHLRPRPHARAAGLRPGHRGPGVLPDGPPPPRVGAGRGGSSGARRGRRSHPHRRRFRRGVRERRRRPESRFEPWSQGCPLRPIPSSQR